MSWYTQLGDLGWTVTLLAVLAIFAGVGLVVHAFTKGRR